MIAVDASVLIAVLDGRDAHHRDAVELLVAVADQPLVASVVSLAEVLVGPARSGRLVEARRALADLAVRSLALGDDAGPALARLRHETGLRLPDCCAIHAAEESRSTRLLSFDVRLRAAAAARGIPST